MRNIGLVALAVLVFVVILVLLVRPRGDEEGQVPEMRFADLFQEGCGAVSPDDLGAPWPDDATLTAIRADWQGLGFRDSTICEELVRNWIYPAGRYPARVTNIAQTPTGRNLSLDERLTFGRLLMKHPQWRMGSMRHYPVLTAALSSTEKSVLSQLAFEHPEAATARSLVGALEHPASEVDRALEELASMGWLTVEGVSDSASYTLVDPAIASAGALQFVQITPASGRSADFASLTATFQDSEALTRGRVAVWGHCADTGRIVRVQLLEGRLRRGRPGNSWAAEVQPPGLSSGLFASERAFASWRDKHENAEVGFNSGVVAFYHRTLEGTEGQ